MNSQLPPDPRLETNLYITENAICDKIDFFFNLSQDEFNVYYARLADEILNIGSRWGVEIPTHVHALGVDKRNQTRMYMVETWGPHCNKLLIDLPHTWYRFIYRFDYKIPVEISTERFDGLYGYIRENQTKKRNLSIFDTRPRQKKEGRNAGGKGIAIGSHKSDTRLAVYKKTGEQGAVEFQFKGKVLETILGDARRLYAGTNHTVSLSSCTMTSAQSKAHNFAIECGFQDAGSMVQYVREIPAEARREASFWHAVSELKATLEQSDHKQRQEIVEQLGIDWKDVVPALETETK